MKSQMKMLIVGVCGSMLVGMTLPVVADEVSPDIVASPEVYKVIAENDQMRVVLATWPAGYKDKVHSHPKMFATYTVKDCHRKLHKSDGTVDEKHLKAGSARVVQPVKAHYFENVGKTECQTVLFEMK
jgi:hypothetical protein